MSSMSGEIAALQAHSNQLQTYLSEWSRKQQALLDSMSMSRTWPPTQTRDLHQQVAGKTSAMDASSLKAASTEDVEIVFLADAAIAETADISAKGSDSNTHYTWMSGSKPENITASTCATVEKNEADDASNPVEMCKGRLSNRLQVSLDKLTGLHRKEQIISWMNDTLRRLEDDISNFDLLTMPEQPDPEEATALPMQMPSHVSAISHKHADQRCCAKIRDLVGAVIHTKMFELLTAAVILFNAILMGISTDNLRKNLQDSESSFMKNAEIVFFSYFTIEVFLRLFAAGKNCFIAEDRYWNWFDLGLVIMSANDQLEPLYSSEGGSSWLNVSFLRLVRLVKMVKLLRMIRLMKMFTHLRLMLASIADSLQAVMWAAIMVALINYVASIIFVSLCTSFLQDAVKQNLDISSNDRLGMETYWGSVIVGMHSLLGATTGGDDWFNIGEPLKAVGWGCYGLFILYLGFFLIVILNTFASLFVQLVFDNNVETKEEVIEAELEKKSEYMSELQDLYDEIDDDEDGCISYEEFCRHAQNPKFQAWASHLQIELSDVKAFFDVLSNYGAKPVNIETFVVGCVRLKGQARSSDMIVMMQHIKHIHKLLSEYSLMIHVNKRHGEHLAREIKEVSKLVAAASPLPVLDDLSRNQTRILALISQLALADRESNLLSL